MKTQDFSIIKQYEGLRLVAYPDPASGGDPFTIGYGTTIYPNGKSVKKGDVITKAQAEDYLKNDVKIRELQLNDVIKTKVNQNQWDALMSFIYNLGIGNLKTSTLLKKLNINPNDISIYNEFLRFDKAGGKPMRGLTLRRQAEADLYFKIDKNK